MHTPIRDILIWEEGTLPRNGTRHRQSNQIDHKNIQKIHSFIKNSTETGYKSAIGGAGVR